MYRYDRPTGAYTQVIPAGTKGLRKHLIEKFGFTRTEVVRDRSRCSAKGSAHCECRAVDAFTRDTAFGNRVFDYLVANYERFGLQAVIWQHRQWGFGKNFEHIRKKGDHFDHVHAEQTIAGSKTWEDDDEMTPEEKKLLESLKKEVFTTGGRSRIDSLDDRVKALEKK